MKAFFDTRQRELDPQQLMSNGRIKPNPEQSERIDRRPKAAKAANYLLDALAGNQIATLTGFQHT